MPQLIDLGQSEVATGLYLFGQQETTSISVSFNTENPPHF